MGIGKRDLQEQAESAAHALISRDKEVATAHERKSRDENEDMVLCLECCTGMDCNEDLCGSRMLKATFFKFTKELNKASSV